MIIGRLGPIIALACMNRLTFSAKMDRVILC
jgi:hypothetical protein